MPLWCYRIFYFLLGIKSNNVLSEFEDAEERVEVNLHYGKLRHKIQSLFDIFFEELEIYKKSGSFQVQEKWDDVIFDSNE